MSKLRKNPGIVETNGEILIVGTNAETKVTKAYGNHENMNRPIYTLIIVPR